MPATSEENMVFVMAMLISAASMWGAIWVSTGSEKPKPKTILATIGLVLLTSVIISRLFGNLGMFSNFLSGILSFLIFRFFLKVSWITAIIISVAWTVIAAILLFAFAKAITI